MHCDPTVNSTKLTWRLQQNVENTQQLRRDPPFEPKGVIGEQVIQHYGRYGIEV